MSTVKILAIVFGVFGLLVAGACGVAFYAMRQVPSRPTSTLAPKGAVGFGDQGSDSKLQTNRRLFLEEHRMDDSARGFIFRGALRKSGQRCDDVESALMTERGVWTVRCPPGHVFIFKFDADGELQGATKVR